MIDSLPEDLLRHRVASADPVVDLSPYLYRLRKRIISRLPPWACYILAQSKKRSVLFARRVTGGK